jgi:3-hydroxyanthranilate 3,4-dioxygenase
MAAPPKAFNLQRWIDEHRDLLKPPVGARMIWKDSQFIVMVIGGPNARRDFHIDPGDEFFYQLQGDMVLEFIDDEGKRQRETIRQGDVLILHSGPRTALDWWSSESEESMSRKAMPGIASTAMKSCMSCREVPEISWTICERLRRSSTTVSLFARVKHADICSLCQQDPACNSSVHERPLI